MSYRIAHITEMNGILEKKFAFSLLKLALSQPQNILTTD